MANRFLDTNYYKSPFVKGLPPELKSFYSFVICDCTAAGIWFLDFDAVKLYTGFELTFETFEKNFIKKRKAIKISDGKYFFPDFIEHQYPGGLSDNNKAHKNILSELRKFNLLTDGSNLPKKEAPLEEPLCDPLQGVQGKDIGNGVGQGLGNGNTGHETKKFTQFPTHEMFNGLPEIKIGSAIELVRITQKVDISDDDVGSMWCIFKEQYLTGKKFYQDEDAVYQHFTNWVKTQKFNNGTNGSGDKQKPSRIDAAKKW